MWSSVTHPPKYNNVLVIKEKSLMGFKPIYFEAPYSLNPWKTRPYEKF